MVEMYLMASASFPLGSFRQDHQQYGLCRVPLSKEIQNSTPSRMTKEGVLGTGYLHLNPTQLADLQKSPCLSLDCNQLVKPVPTVKGSVLIDVQDARPDSVLFSFGIAEQCIRHEKILRFLKSGSSVSNGENLDVSLIRDLMGLHTLSIGMHPHSHIPLDDEFYPPYDIENDSPSSLIFGGRESFSPMPQVDFIGDPSFDSMMTVNQDGRVLFMGTEAKIKHLLSIVAKIYMSQSARGMRRREMVVPYFRRSGAKARSNARGYAKLSTVTAAPFKSHDKIKLKEVSKKKQKRKAGAERETCENSFSQVCESLLSVILIKNHNRMALYSLKKHGHELPAVLIQFSAGIAGTGIAVLFSVIWKLTTGRMPLCTTKLLNTGFGIGLVWLSFAVNMLRDTIIEITKSSNKLKLKEDEISNKVVKSVNEVLLRAAAVMAVVVFRFA